MTSPTHLTKKRFTFDPLFPLKRWLNSMEVTSTSFAHFICRMIPCSCPFEQTITIFGRKVIHIPPLCKLNPFYHEFVGLRLKALTYLADIRGEDVEHYIC